MPAFRHTGRSLLLMVCLGLLLLGTSAGAAAAFDGRAISAAAEHSCAIDSAGAAKCWGGGWAGRLGDGTSEDSAVPVQVAGLTSGVTAISAGDSHTCAVVGGAAKCWGDDSDDQLGNGADGSSNTPVDVVGLASGVTAISAGRGYTCAVVSGTAMCWGSNVNGRLGNGTYADDSDVPVAVGGLDSGVTAISAGDEHACAIVSGAAKCWGSGWDGQLGDGESETPEAPVDVVGLDSGVTAISAGFTHTCAVVGGAAKCWGSDGQGQLGNGPDLGDSATPITVAGLETGVTMISAGYEHSCAIVAGAAKCWGDGEFDQLGQVGSADSQTPVDVTGMGSGVHVISAGYRHTCVIASNTSKCWGDNSWAQLGTGSNGTADVPVGVSDLTSGVSLISAGTRHSCAVVSGAAKCWGDGTSGQLGDGTATSSNVPVNVTGLGVGAVTAISAGESHTCAVVSDAAKCWGDDFDGQLGNGPAGSSNTPVDVAGLGSGVTAISAGRNHTCAVVGGAAMCWGSDTNGKLGNGPDANESDVPIAVDGLASGVTAISAGEDYTCAIVNDAAKCWGSGWDGQLGDGTAESSELPLDVADIPVNLGEVVSDISAGGGHTCAVSAGAAWCWGYDWDGQLGNGPGDESYKPFAVVGLTSGVTAISVGLLHSCAIVSGTAKCWGNGEYGRLGNGDDLNSQSPVDVTTVPGETVEAIDAGAYHTCAIISGAAKCWGDGYWGGLGDGSSGSSATPIGVAGFTPLDIFAPTITLNGPSGKINDKTPTVTGSLDEPGTATIVIKDKNDVDVKVCNNVTVSAAPLFAFDCTTDELTDGDYSFTVNATDEADNDAAPESGSFTLDTVAPTITNVAPVDGFSTTDPSVSLTYTVTDDVDPSPICTPASSSVIALNVGSNAITIDCADATGNHASPVVVNVTRVAPPAPPTQPVAPAAAKVKLGLKRSGKARIKGRRVTFKVIASFKLPAGATRTNACKGKLKATTRPKGARRAAKASGKLRAKGSTCRARLSFKLPKKFKGKKVKVTLSFAGNGSVAKFNKNVRHRVR